MKVSSIFGPVVRTVVGFVLATIAATLAGVSFHTQSVLARLSSMGVSIPPDQRLDSMARDIIGLSPAYGAVIAIALAIGFTIAALIKPRAGILAPAAFPLGGAAAVAAALVAMHFVYNGTTPIAGARGPLGFFLQSLAGGLGGLVFSFAAAARKR